VVLIKEVQNRGAGGGSMRNRYQPVKASFTAVSAGGRHSSLFQAK
jgi:hypothetical protein